MTGSVAARDVLTFLLRQVNEKQTKKSNAGLKALFVSCPVTSGMGQQVSTLVAARRSVI